MHFNFPAIGIIHSCFTDKFGIPRQSRLVPLATARLELLPPYNDINALDGLESCSHIWVQFVFHANKHEENNKKLWKPKVKPPRLGGNKTLGVFATRSPTRPSPIGLSVVKLEKFYAENDKVFLDLSGVDFLDGTPVLDIKPYVPYADNVAEATNSFAQAVPTLIVVNFNSQTDIFCSHYVANYNIQLKKLIRQILQQDPRPQYQKIDTARIYGMQLFDMDIRWCYEVENEKHSICVQEIVAFQKK